MIVAGIDLSLTSTGIAVTDGTTTAIERIRSTGRADATLADRTRRLRGIRSSILTAALGAHLVVIEGPSYGQQRQGGTHDRAGLWWLVVDALPDNDPWLPIVEVPPACRARYATGKGNASKDAVLAAAVKRYPAVDITGNDVADAVLLAAMGSRYCGAPLEESLPQAHLAAMSGVVWPALGQLAPAARVGVAR